MIALPPSLAGAVQVRVAPLSRGIPVTAVGAPGADVVVASETVRGAAVSGTWAVVRVCGCVMPDDVLGACAAGVDGLALPVAFGTAGPATGPAGAAALIRTSEAPPAGAASEAGATTRWW